MVIDVVLTEILLTWGVPRKRPRQIREASTYFVTYLRIRTTDAHLACFARVQDLVPPHPSALLS